MSPAFFLMMCLAALCAHAGRLRHGDDKHGNHRALTEDGPDASVLQVFSADKQLPALMLRCMADSACSLALSELQVPSEGFRSDLQQQQQEQRQLQLGEAGAIADGLEVGERRAGGGESTPDGGGSRPLSDGGKTSGAAGGDGSSEVDRVGLGVVRPGGRGRWQTVNDGAAREEDGGERTSLSLKALAALVLLLEAVAGMYLPLLLWRLKSPQWWLSLLNCFSGGIFLAAGIVHLLPHCAEAQEALGPVGPNGGDYPLYLVLVVVGYCVVFYVERVLFDVHGEGHWHCQHSNVFSHSSYYKNLSHRSQLAYRPSALSATAVAGGHQPCAPDLAAAWSAPTPGHPLVRLAPNQPQSGPHSPCLPLLGLAGTATSGCTSRGTCGGSGGSSAGGAAPLTTGGSCSTGGSEVGASSTPVCADGAVTEPRSVEFAARADGAGHGARVVCAPAPPSAFPAAATGCGDDVGVVASLNLGVEPDLGPVAEAAAARSEAEALDGGAVGEEYAESCHSEHSPRAVCVCLEQEAEEEAEEEKARERQGAPPPRAMGHGYSDHMQVGHGHGHSQHRHQPHVRSTDCSPLGTSPRFVPPLPTVPPPLPRWSAGDGTSIPILTPNKHHHRHQQQHQHQHSGMGCPQSPASPSRRRRQSTSCTERPAAASAAYDSTGCMSNGASWVAPHGLAFQYHLRPDGSGGPRSPLLQHHPHQHTGHGHSDGYGRSLRHGQHHHEHHHHHHHHEIKPRFRFMHGVVLLVALALHTALECVALGLADSRNEFMVLFVAIASHKAVSALALSSRFLKEGATLLQVTSYVGPFCLVAPLSILAGVYVGRVAPLARLIFSCFATGTFLYVGASEVIMEEFEGEMRADRRDISTRAARYIKFGAVLAAVALVAASGLLPEPDHH